MYKENHDSISQNQKTYGSFHIFQVLQKLDLECMFEGKTVADGEMFSVEDIENGPEAFTASIDIGKIRATTGAKVFAVVKGAIDGGISLPYR